MASERETGGLLEGLFLLGVLATAGWMVVEATGFQRTGTRLYPLLTGGIVVALVGVLLAWQLLLPERLQRRLASDTEAISYGSVDEDGDAETGAEAIDERQVGAMLLGFLGFVVLAYAVGFLLASLVYVYATQLQFGYGTRRRRLTVTVLVGGLVYLGYLVLGIDLLYGAVFEFLLA